MSLVVESVWASVQTELKKLLPDVIYNQWFSRAEAVAFDGDRFELGVQNRFFKSRIETTYMENLVAAVHSAVGKTVEVRITVSAKLLAEFRKAQEQAKSEPVDVAITAPAQIFTKPPAKAKKLGIKLNPDYTFDNFVIGPANRLSHAVGMRAVQSPGEYNPLFFCGQHGVGKTHLLQAICSEMRSQPGLENVIYVTADRFVAEFASASTTNTVKEFRERYRKADALVIDELQSLGVGKRIGSQAELLGIIDELTAHDKQVVFGAICTPHELEGIDPKLRDRLGAGFVDKLLLPDEETRRKLLARKMSERGISLPESAVAMLARELSGNIRKLEGTVQRLAALIEFEGMEPTTYCIRLALEVATPASRSQALTFDDVAKAVCDEFSITQDALRGRGRTASLRKARQIAITLCRNLIGGRHTELGAFFGGRSHATIISTLKNMPIELFGSGIEGRSVERILFQLGINMKPEDIVKRQKSLFDNG